MFPLKVIKSVTLKSEGVKSWQPSWMVQWEFGSHRDYRLKNDWKLKAKIRAKISPKWSNFKAVNKGSLSVSIKTFFS